MSQQKLNLTEVEKEIMESWPTLKYKSLCEKLAEYQLEIAYHKSKEAQTVVGVEKAKEIVEKLERAVKTLNLEKSFLQVYLKKKNADR